MAKKSLSKGARDNRANQINPKHPVYHRARGMTARQAEVQTAHPKPAVDNHANQLNRNDGTYPSSAGLSRPSGSSSNASSATSE
jgi:hypothetical protein